jgi:hypothetical protein
MSAESALGVLGPVRDACEALCKSKLEGKACTGPLELKPGDEFKIKLGCKQIRHRPAVRPYVEE